ncbi:D-3-phosphoglycerate dehydrogenase [Rhodococcus wratislaviensis]|uniref:D-3-phosphoglycerate dehydrogenase n=1 Tax=Rhodococcus wratislaviensis TaxID=44752 RepID=A0AB38FD33_RHOWR|nr:C-terminal binding protein [Rhodococcus wratislaviensis]REE75450.1 D-3-phosphoglycerate dehydrogenase [Rhodococcus wratislaviensis]SPZ39516.1 d-3-phosphoglycerate dehydrogenase [Rhodococcus wratislaviensis]
MTFKVYVSDYDYPDLEIERSVLEPIGAEVLGLQCRTGHGLGELARDADAIIQQYAKIDATTINALERCKVIARYGIGVDILDVEAATNAGIVVTNVPDYCIEEVADHSISMAFTLIRSIPAYDRATKSGTWHWASWNQPVRRMRGSVFGFVGFGRIAQNMARKLAAFGLDLVAYDPFVSESLMRTHGVRKTELAELLEVADVVDVMCPWTPATHHLIDEAALLSMKPGALLVNCARGKVVDNDALYKALISGHLAGAALDDTEEEPAKQDSWSPDQNPLFGLDNCVITPHVAYISQEALDECRLTAAQNVRAVLLGEQPLNPVAVPALALAH